MGLRRGDGGFEGTNESQVRLEIEVSGERVIIIGTGVPLHIGLLDELPDPLLASSCESDGDAVLEGDLK